MRTSGQTAAFVRAVGALSRPPVGPVGRLHLVRDDLALSRVLCEVIKTYRELEAETGEPDAIADYLERLNAALLDRLQHIGGAFLYEAMVDGKYVLRTSIINFRATLADVEALPEIVTRLGRQVDRELRPRWLMVA